MLINSSGIVGGARVVALASLVATCCFAAGVFAETAAVDSTAFDEEVVVTASRYGTDVHLSHSNLSTAEIRRQAADRDVPLMLSDLPGVYAFSDGGTGLGSSYVMVRGFDQRRVGVMINGIPLNDPEDHQVYWYDMPDLAGSLQDIQVQRGVTNSIGGMPAIGGTINLETEELQDIEQGRAKLSVGSYGTATQGLTWQSGLVEGRFQTKLRVSHLESEGYRDHSSIDQWGVFWGGAMRTDRSRTQINVYTGRVQSDLAYYPSAAADLELDHGHNSITNDHDRDDFRQPHYELHHEYALGDDTTLKNAFFLIHGEGFYERLREGEDAADFSLDVLMGLAPDAEVDLVNRKWVRKDQIGWAPRLVAEHSRGTLTVGGDWYTFHSSHWGELLSVDGAQLSGTDEHGMKYHAYTGDKDAWSAFASERFELGSGVTLLVDLQLQHRQYDFKQKAVGGFTGNDRHAYSVDYDFFNPKGGLYWQSPWSPADASLGFYGHVGIAHREPTDADLFHQWQAPDDLGAEPNFRTSTVAADEQGDYRVWSDPVAEAEKVINYEIGTALRTDDFSLTINGYWMDFSNEIAPTGDYDDEGRAVMGNVDKAEHRGVELGLRARLSERHMLAVAASRSWDRFADAPNPAWEGNPITGFPRHLLTVSWRADLSRCDAALVVRSVGKQYLDNLEDENHVLDGHTTVDVSVGVDLAELGFDGLAGLRADLHLRNVLDERYETSGYWDSWYDEAYLVPAAGRNLLASVGWDF